MEKGLKTLYNNNKIRNFALTVLAVVVAFFVLKSLIDAGIIGNYYARIIMVVGINIILAVSLNLVLGFTGQLTLGHAGFMSIGAYSAAMITMKLHSPLIISLLLGGMAAALIGTLIGYPILRLKGDYLAICTLGFGQIIMVVIQNIDYIGGPRGLSGIPIKTNFAWVYFTMAITVLIIHNVIKSSQGRAMVSVREDEIAAEAMGINTTKYKLMAFVIGAFFAGIAGGLYAHYYSFIDPKSFDFLRSMEILTFVVFGGMGSLSGSVLAAGALTFLPELLRDLSDVMKEYRIIIYAILLIVLMIFRPQGLMGTKELPDLFKRKKRTTEKGGDEDVIA